MKDVVIGILLGISVVMAYLVWEQRNLPNKINTLEKVLVNCLNKEGGVIVDKEVFHCECVSYGPTGKP